MESIKFGPCDSGGEEAKYVNWTSLYFIHACLSWTIINNENRHLLPDRPWDLGLTLSVPLSAVHDKREDLQDLLCAVNDVRVDCANVWEQCCDRCKPSATHSVSSLIPMHAWLYFTYHTANNKKPDGSLRMKLHSYSRNVRGQFWKIPSIFVI